ncbi:claudin-4-like [Salvelinus namaycush]|uniref:Claudin-4-like n=1 Tax=Salvelinus namaycush TaxID=8040 RepID=A0A8U0PA83_SALNM|nr:claudin-4-like [Salvelinus namaycush]
MDIMDIVFIVEMVEIVGIALGVIGLILTIVICALPTWIVTTFIADNSANTEVVWYGLWMSCVTQGRGKTQCEVYNYMEYWKYDLQPARAMILTAIILGVLGVLFFMFGAKSTNCIKDKTSQAKLIIIAGILFILAGFLILIPVSLLARSIISDSSTRIKGKTELGNSLYIGWVAASLLLIGGVTLCITVGVFGWMMGIFGWIVSLVPSALSVWIPFRHYPEPHYRDIWMVLTITSISTILGALGVMGFIFGTRCCNCIKSNRIRVKARFIVGTFFILTGILQFTTVFLVDHYLRTDVHLQLYPFVLFTQHDLVILAEVCRWSTSMLLIGGTILCCCIFKRNQPDSTTTTSTSR